MFIAISTLLAVRSSGAPCALMPPLTSRSYRSGSILDIRAINMLLLRSRNQYVAPPEQGPNIVLLRSRDLALMTLRVNTLNQHLCVFVVNSCPNSAHLTNI